MPPPPGSATELFIIDHLLDHLLYHLRSGVRGIYREDHIVFRGEVREISRHQRSIKVDFRN